MPQPDTTLTIHVTPEQRERIEQLARERGYDTPDDYLLALVDADEEIYDPADAFREGWHDIVTGNVYPIETLWDGIENE